MTIIKTKRGRGLVPRLNEGELGYSFDRKRLEIGTAGGTNETIGVNSVYFTTLGNPIFANENTLLFSLDIFYPNGGHTPTPSALRLSKIYEFTSANVKIEHTGFTFVLHELSGAYYVECTKPNHGLAMNTAIGNFVVESNYAYTPYTPEQ